ncbi:DUF6543 domain-containing protein [Pseudomonas sp. dw_612]|uniref:dermonecrotic toxin domain-containing protein n=1 Tax=Pseudomonas sp. dw_612 TaxID=2720080 RepID=UPI001BD40864|nr:DUF6543 domain-containing protein [Pseudomonas sp. dw_612]
MPVPPSNRPATAEPNVIARSISARFSTRPTLRSVTASLLKERLLDTLPPLAFDPEMTRIAQPLPEGGWRIGLLLDLALEYLASGKPPSLIEQFGQSCFLTNRAPARLTRSTTAREQDMSLIAEVIRELPALVPIAFQEMLADYWNSDIDAGASRWQWLGDLLNGVLKTAAVRHASQNKQQSDLLIELTRHPDKQQRQQAPWANGVIHAHTLETTLVGDAGTFKLQSPDLLVINGETLLLCSVTGNIEAFASREAFEEAWAARFQQVFMTEAITWKRFEPDGNFFDTQAALLLNQQLDDLTAVRLPASERLDVLEQRYDAITDVAAMFVDQAPSPMLFQHLESNTPTWLQNASAVDRMAYRKQVVEYASVTQQNLRRTFQAGVDDLHTFAKKALHEQMLKDQPLAPGYDADQLELTFHVPVGDLGSGYLEPVKMSLTELAIKNLAGRPKGRMTIRHTEEQLIQDWTSESYLLGLVSKVDIGKHYPEMIQTALLADTPEAHERARLFGQELAISLPLLALEHSIKAEQGFTRQGYRYVAAVMHKTNAERHVNGQEIVLRPLAFQRKTGAECDVVGNMFIIEPRDLKADGPRILYRPLYSPALQQYPSRQALLRAIAQAGPLQTSVLTWLEDRARPIYDNNGFNEPHIVRFLPGDEFARPDTPAPATLVGDEAAADWLAALQQGQLLARLFDSNARALVQQGDRQSVSNIESRWVIILEGGWLLFNNLLLPMLSGPAMLVGWLVQVTHSLIQDLPALDSTDTTARQQAWVDVLLNLGLIMLHVAQNRGSGGEIRHASEPPPTPVALDSLRRPSALPHLFAEGPVTEAPPGLASEPPGSGHTLLDFNLSTARDSATARLIEQLKPVRVPWPTPLPEPVSAGVFQGLFRINGQWHTSIAGLLFRVRIVPGFGEVFLVTREHPDNPGIKLKSNGRGHWTLDQGLQLVGGGRRQRMAEARENRRERVQELVLQHQEFVKQQARVQKRVDIADNLMVLKERDPASAQQQRHEARQRFGLELDNQTQTYVSLIAGLKELSALTDVPPDHSLISDLLEFIIKNTRKRVVIADLERLAAEKKYSDFNKGEQQIHDAMQAEGMAVVERYFEYMRETSEINESMIKDYEEVNKRMEELAEIPLFGAKAIKRLNHDRPENELTALALKSFQLTVLRILSVKSLGTDTTTALETAIDPLLMLSQSHAELHTRHVYERSDRIAVLNNLVDHYSNAQDALGSIAIFSADELQMPAFNRLRMIIHQLHLDAEQRLVQEIQQLVPDQPPPSDAPGTSTSEPVAGSSKVPGPSKKPLSSNSRRKVIKTSKGTLIGEVRPRVADQDGDIVDIKDPMKDQPLASFHEHEPNVWVEIVEAKASAPKPSALPYPQIKGEARKALAKVDEQIRKIESYVEKASSPKEIEEQLQREAQKLTRYADKLDTHEQAPRGSGKDVTLITALRDKARVLESKATHLRQNMTLTRLPTDEGIEYLLQKQVLHVEPVGRRAPLSTGRKDFMQEYALLDSRRKAVWYAHFHYAELADNKADFTTAHLKTKAQRYETYESALAKAKEPKQKIEIYRGLISRPVADRYLLPFEPS